MNISVRSDIRREGTHFSALVCSEMGITFVFLFVVLSCCYHVVTTRLLVGEFVQVVDRQRMIRDI